MRDLVSPVANIGTVTLLSDLCGSFPPESFAIRDNVESNRACVLSLLKILVNGRTGALALPTYLYYSSVTASLWQEGGDRAKSADPEVDSLVRDLGCSVMTEADHFATKTSNLSLFTGKSGSGFDAGSIRTDEAMGAGLEETYVPEWMVTRGFELNDGRLCANMIDHFTPPAFFKTVRGMEHEQSLAEEKNILLEAKDKEIEDLKSQLLKAKEESAKVTQLCAQVSGLEATKNSLRGEVASAKDHNVLLEQECALLLGSPNQSPFYQTKLPEMMLISPGVVCAFKRVSIRKPPQCRVVEDVTNSWDEAILLVKCLNQNEYMEALGHSFWIGSSWQPSLSVCFEFAVGEWRKWGKESLLNVSPFERRFVSIDDPLTAEALIEPPAREYDNPDSERMWFGERYPRFQKK
ncbi:hypothetical protein Tco_1000104 [Tanacetum coccineum]